MANGTDVTLQATYSFRKTQAQDWTGIDSTSHQLVTSTTFDVPGPWSFFTRGTVASADYNVFPGDPASNRDGTSYEWIGGLAYTFDSPALREVSAYAGYQRNDASGANWSYTGWTIGADAQFNIAGPILVGKLGASYAARDYVGDFTSQGFTAPGRQNQQVTTLDAQLILFAGPTHTFDLGLTHQIVDSNSPEFTGSKTSLTGGLTVRLH
jgi:hypothetical protein